MKRKFYYQNNQSEILDLLWTEAPADSIGKAKNQHPIAFLKPRYSNLI